MNSRLGGGRRRLPRFLTTSELIFLGHLFVCEDSDDGADPAHGVSGVMKLQEERGLLRLLPEPVVDELHQGVNLDGAQVSNHFGLRLGGLDLAEDRGA